MPGTHRTAPVHRRLAAMGALALAAACQGAAAEVPMCGISNLAATALAKLNALRAAGADCRVHGQFGRARPLEWNLLLMQAAHGHSHDMATRDYFSHVSLDGRTFSDRISGTGYEWLNIGEDLAAGHHGIDEAIDAWMASDSHCATLMNPKLTEVGMACVFGGPRNRYRTYWTMDLGQPR